uniref:GRF-type domain-containing protein n=1 Tax=Oryza glumipatula TaxID=40148 RepID=A0A0E0BAJ1_9ORYZ
MASSRSEGSSASSRRTSASPIPYRVGPFDYHPAVLCRCGTKAAKWISWSVDNPDRRYYKCANARSGGCDFFDWYEGPTSSFIRDLLNDLRAAVFNLRREKDELQIAVEDGRSKALELDEATQELDTLRRELATVRSAANESEAKLAVLKDRNCRLENERIVLLSLLVVVCAICFILACNMSQNLMDM